MHMWHIPPGSMWFGHTGLPQIRHDTVVGARHRWQSDATIPIESNIEGPCAYTLSRKGETIGQGSFEIKRGHTKNIEGDKLGAVLKDAFGNSKDLGGGKFEASIGPLTVKTWIDGKNSLGFESNQPTQIDDATATAIVRARNKFLEAATGFNAGHRKKRATKAVAGADE